MQKDEKPIECLTKEDFWNNILAKYPGEYNRFSLWIDEYKKKVNWPILFNSNSDYQNAAGKNATEPKYHDLPIAIQFGIFFQYVMEIPHRYEFFESMSMSWTTMIDNIEAWFRQEENFTNEEANSGLQSSPY